jgi:hypothetical protein
MPKGRDKTMKLYLVPFALFPLLSIPACASDVAAPVIASGAGGSAPATVAKGGSTAVAGGGTTAVAPITAPTQIREIKVDTVLDAGTPEEGSAIIGNLFSLDNKNPLWDPNDPCMTAWVWRDATNTKLVAGTPNDLTLFEGKVYRWVGPDPMTYAQNVCTPKTTTEWCAKCWEATNIECADVELGMTEDTTGQGGAGALGTLVGPAASRGGSTSVGSTGGATSR